MAIANPHLKLAIVIAPLLAIGGWGLAEMYWSHTHPDAAARLAPRRACNMRVKACRLKAGDLQLFIRGEFNERGLRAVRIDSSMPLDTVLISIAPLHAERDRPVRLRSTDGRTWRARLAGAPPPGREARRLRLVATAGGKTYIGETRIRY
jgi:hypothetical protein